MRLTYLFLSLSTIFSVASATAAEMKIDYQSPEMQTLKEEYEAAGKRLEKTYQERLTELLERHTAKAQEFLTAKREQRTLAALALGRKATQIFEECKAQLEETGKFELPHNVRKELEPLVAGCREEKVPIDQQYEADKRELRRTTVKQFAEEIREQGQPALSGRELTDAFEELLASEPAPPPVPGEGTTDGEPQGGPEQQQPAEPIVLASTLTDDVEGARRAWLPVGKLVAEIRALVVFDVNVLDQGEPVTVSGTDPVEGQNYHAAYAPVRRLLSEVRYEFRAKSVPGKDPLQIVQWPSPTTNGKIVVRARPGAEFPSKHAVEIEVSAPAGVSVPQPELVKTVEPEKLLEGETTKTSASLEKVPVRVRTTPAGAIVFVDGGIVRKDDRAMVTPCTIQMTVGKHHVRIKKTTYFDGIVPEYKATKGGGELHVELERNPAYVQMELDVSSRTTWRSSRLALRKGDRLLVEAQGEWSCGRLGEMTGPEGYPQTRKYSHYYGQGTKELRQTMRANYGTLLMRVGKDGPLIPVSKRKAIKVDGDGELYFDINEIDDQKQRRDNQGALVVKIKKAPPPE